MSCALGRHLRHQAHLLRQHLERHLEGQRRAVCLHGRHVRCPARGLERGQLHLQALRLGTEGYTLEQPRGEVEMGLDPESKSVSK